MTDTAVPVIYMKRHGEWTWKVYDLGNGYDVWRVRNDYGQVYKEYVSSHWLKFFAIRRCRKAIVINDKFRG